MYTFSDYLKKYEEFGIVEEVRHPVVKVMGLPSVKPGEVVVFESNHLGQVLHMDEVVVEVLVFAKEPIPPKVQVARTGKSLSMLASDRLLGKVVNPLGSTFYRIKQSEVGTRKSGKDGHKKSDEQFFQEVGEERVLDIRPLSIVKRLQISEPLVTGVGLVDLLLPLGKGQRELVVGDRKTGKTSFLLTAMKSQIQQGSKVIYAAIGKQLLEIDLVKQWLEKENLIERVVMVASTAHDSQSLVYLTPFTAMTLAEYFRDLGENVLVILDDLSTHAKFYREISLLAGRFPGRDSYPGDIFYTHARLLERAGNFVHPKQVSVSISCLPVAETTENDLSDYIISNLIGITDGHLLFDSREFIKGRRPAINALASVTRVGRQTQLLLHQNISQQLLTFLSDYQRSQRYSHFGAESTDKMKEELKKGNLLFDFFNQDVELVLPLDIQLLFVGMIWLQLIGPEFTEKRKENEQVTPGSQSQDARDSIKSQMIMAEYRLKLLDTYNRDQEFRKWVSEVVQLADLYEMMEKLNANRAKLLDIIKS